MAEAQPTQNPNKHHSLGGILLPLLLVAGFAYLLFRPIPPSVYPEFAKFSGTLTVSHSQAILGAQLNEHSSRYLLDVLDGCRFKDTSDTPENSEETITLIFGENGEFVLYSEVDCTLVTVKKGEATGNYRLKADVYEKVLTVINAAFPDGVQALEFLPWWQQYLSIASQTLLKTDFKSPKEIPFEDVVFYTYLQMVADGSAKEFQTDTSGTKIDAIPYDLFLRRARQYFAEGASTTMKQSQFYWADTNSFLFPARPEENYGNYPYGQPEEQRPGAPYRLSALTRDSSGYITAVFEDYSALGFQNQGTLTRLHYLTLVPGAEGEYRFASKRSELVNQSTVSAEGYFLSLSTIGEMTPEQAYSSDLESFTLGEDLILYTVRYSTEATRLTLYRVSPATGSLLGKQVIEGSPSTIFLGLKAGEGELLVKTNESVIRLAATGDMEKTGEIRLPLGKISTFYAYGYDITADCTRLIYGDGEGIKSYQLKTGISSLILPYPTKEETPSSSQSSSSQPEGSKYTRPADFVMPPLNLPITPPMEVQKVITEYYRRPVLVDGESSLLVAITDEKEVLSYGLIDLTAEKRDLEKLDVKPITGGVEYVDEEKILIAKYPEATGEEETVELLTEYSLRYFDGKKARRFSLDYDPTAPTQLVSGDYLYYFSHEIGPDGSSATDHFYRLVQVDLKTLEQKPLSVLIQNALPQVLAVGEGEQVLFSYRAPAGMGFGITRSPLGGSEVQ